MRRKIYTICMAAAIMAAMTGCGSNNKDGAEGVTVKEDFVEFVGTEIPEAETKETEAMTAYNAYFAEGTAIDTEALLTDLNDNIIPKYEEFLADVDAIETSTDEVGNLKDMYYDAMNTQYQALQKVQSALTDKSEDAQSEAQTLLTSASEKYTQYNDAVYALAEQENITLSGEIGTTVATEAQSTTEGNTEAVTPSEEVTEEITD